MSLRACGDVVATGAALPTRGGPKKRFNISIMRSWGRGSFDGLFYERVKMRWELVAPLITVYGRLKASDIDGFFHTTFMPIAVS